MSNKNADTTLLHEDRRFQAVLFAYEAQKRVARRWKEWMDRLAAASINARALGCYDTVFQQEIVEEAIHNADQGYFEPFKQLVLDSEQFIMEARLRARNPDA
jgi:hypothetical protein